MAAIIIDGKVVSQKIKEELKKEVEYLKGKGIVPGLTVVLVGEDPASQVYVRMKEKASSELGINSNIYRLKENTSEEEIISIIEQLNNDDSVHGILVQLPLPSKISEEKVMEKISPLKDVDGFHPINMGRLLRGDEVNLLPCTPSGIMELLHFYNIEMKSKNAVVVGRSNIVGKPVALLLLREHATVTLCHSRTRDLKETVKNGDIVIAAVGKAGIITGEMIKDGAVVIDVGVNKDNDKLSGDVKYEEVKEKASYITPVPGGVGPMTIAMLLKNTITAAKNITSKNYF